MSETTVRRIPLLLWPFYAVWRLLTIILAVTGRIVCALLGIVLVVVGVAVTMSVIGAPLGIALTLFGFLLIVRGLF